MATFPVLAITGYLFFEGRHSERLLLEAETARQADNALLQFGGFVAAQVSTLKNVGSFVLTAPGDVVDGDFVPFANRLLAENPDLQSIVWKRPVGEAQQMIAAAPGLGHSLQTPPAPLLREAEAKSTANGQPVATPSFQLLPGQEAMVVVIPLLIDGRSHGWVEGTICLTQAVQKLFGRDELDFWNVEIYDRSGRCAFRAGGDESGFGSARSASLVERHVPVADRAWKLRLSPTPLLISTLRTGAPWRILGIGVVATLLLAFANYLLTQHQVRLALSLRESKRLAADVEKTRRHLSDLVNGVDAAIWESDVEMRRFTFVNDYARKLLRIEPARWVSKPSFWFEHVHPDDRDRATAHARAAQIPGETYAAEYRMLDSDDTVLWVREIITVIEAAGSAVGKRGVVVDITARVQAEEALRQSQKLESLGVLAGGIAHDFNNLLTTILGNAELLKPLVDKPSSAGRGPLEKIERTTRRLAELTRQMLAYSGRGRFSIERVDLNAVIREMAELLAVSTPKNVRVSYRFEPELPPMEGDAAQIRQVILNLLTNAAEAIGNAPGGSVLLCTDALTLDPDEAAELYPEQDLQPGDYVFLEVSDNGTGMDEETQSKIFDPFFTTKFTGRGLGLAALRGIVRGHRGGIRIFSRPSEGTVFTIIFPAVRDVAPVTPVAPGTLALTSALAHAHVLVVDDEEGLRSLMVCALEDAGCTVYEAADGVEGMERFHEHRDEIDVVVLDLTMPRLGGDEMFRRIHTSRPETRVILCSGYTEEDIVRRFDGDGLAGFIEKPFKPSELIKKIGAVLAERAELFDGKYLADGTRNDGRTNLAAGS